MSRRPRSACPRRPRGLWLRDRPSTGRRDRRGRTDCHFLPSTASAHLSPIQDSRRAPNPDGPPAALSHRPNRSLVAPWREMGSKPRHLAPMSPKGANTNRSSQPLDRSATAADALTEFLSRLVRDYRVPFSRRMKSAARRASRDVEHAGRALIEILRLPLIDREKDVVQCPEEPRATPVRLESGRLETAGKPWDSRNRCQTVLLRARHMRQFSASARNGRFKEVRHGETGFPSRWAALRVGRRTNSTLRHKSGV